MYNLNHNNHIYIDYCNKTNRKIEYFSELNDYKFIAIFPSEIRSKNKLYNKLKILLKGGEISGKNR
jgi:hypothetical protein